MPIFRVRLEDPDSKHFRLSSVEAADKREAKRIVDLREYRAVTYEADDYDDLKAAEDERGFDGLSGAERARLHTHRQLKPYEVVKIEKVG